MNEQQAPETDPDELIQLTRGELDQIAIAAGHHVGRIHRRRLVFQSLLASTLATVAVGTPIGLAIHDNTVDAARNSALYDCQLNQTLAGDLAQFVSSDAQLRVKQAKLNVTKRLLADIERVIPLGDLKASQQASAALSAQYANTWTYTYLPQLEQLVTVDCPKRTP